MATLKEFEEALKAYNMVSALAVLEELRKKDKAKRTVTPARRVVGKKMTPELAHQVLDLHKTTAMTQQEIAFKLGVNQGRVNEVIKHGKWLTADPNTPEAKARDQALKRMATPPARTIRKPSTETGPQNRPVSARRRKGPAQLSLGDF